jgi:hypothetical protein
VDTIFNYESNTNNYNIVNIKDNNVVSEIETFNNKESIEQLIKKIDKYINK